MALRDNLTKKCSVLHAEAPDMRRSGSRLGCLQRHLHCLPLIKLIADHGFRRSRLVEDVLADIRCLSARAFFNFSLRPAGATRPDGRNVLCTMRSETSWEFPALRKVSVVAASSVNFIRF